MTRPQAERIAVLETKVDQMLASLAAEREARVDEARQLAELTSRVDKTLASIDGGRRVALVAFSIGGTIMAGIGAAVKSAVDVLMR